MSDFPTPPRARRPTTAPDRTVLAADLPWAAASIAEARARVRAAAAELHLPPATVRQSVLAVSELVSNAIQHGTPPLGLRLLELPQGVRLEVDDASPRTPAVLAVPGTADNGRGLSIVDSVSSSWGHYLTDTGKCVWCDVGASPA